MKIKLKDNSNLIITGGSDSQVLLNDDALAKQSALSSLAG